MDIEPEFWFCLTHLVVEGRGKTCEDSDRLGPYPARAAAERALEWVRERSDTGDTDVGLDDSDVEG